MPLLELPTNCPGCGVGISAEELSRQAYTCECGHHFRMGADAWIALLSDEGSFSERWADIRPHDLLQLRLPKPYHVVIDEARAEGRNEAVRTGAGRIGGRPEYPGEAWTSGGVDRATTTGAAAATGD